MTDRNVFAFDVDHTLWLSDGPVLLADILGLRIQGHIVGICGNWGLFTSRLPGWANVASFIGPIGTDKITMLSQIRTYVPAREYIMVGNDPAVFGASNDLAAAAAAGWRFIREHEFRRGER